MGPQYAGAGGGCQGESREDEVEGDGGRVVSAGRLTCGVEGGHPPLREATKFESDPYFASVSYWRGTR
jgi:hypothetical protein